MRKVKLPPLKKKDTFCQSPFLSKESKIELHRDNDIGITTTRNDLLSMSAICWLVETPPYYQSRLLETP